MCKWPLKRHMKNEFFPREKKIAVKKKYTQIFLLDNVKYIDKDIFFRYRRVNFEKSRTKRRNSRN